MFLKILFIRFEKVVSVFIKLKGIIKYLNNLYLYLKAVFYLLFFYMRIKLKLVLRFIFINYLVFLNLFYIFEIRGNK